MNLDYSIFQQINNLAGHWAFLDALAIFLAGNFQYFLSGFLLLYLLIGKSQAEKVKNRWMVAVAFLSAAVSRLVFCEIIKVLINRPRPFETYNLIPLLSNEIGQSFPSGHAAFFFALAMAVTLFNKKVHLERSRRAGIWLFVGAFLISLARIYAGVHYPSDILAGAAVGVFSGWLVWRIFKKYKAT
jgi:undecaprenyl-diphosphatase